MLNLKLDFPIFNIMKWHKIPSSAIRTKAPVQLLQLAGQKFCLIYYQGEWHATSYKCPHAGANLADGWCEEGKIICPYHRHSFNLIDGKGTKGQNNAIRIYRLELRQDDLYVELPESMINKLLNLFK